MTVSFNQIPSALRYPGVYIEVDGSQAGLGGDIPAVLIVGQKLATGTAPAGEITLVGSVADAKTKAGAGSMLAKMVEAYRKGDSALDVYMLPYADNAAGVAAKGSVVMTASPTADGVLSLYIAGVLVGVGVTAGQTPAAIATAMAAAINAADVCVTAAAAATVTLTARHKGSIGNDIDLRINLYGEKSPTGMAQSITAMQDGVGDPAPGDIRAIIGQRWYRYAVLGINNDATMAAWHAESRYRYGALVQQGFRGFAAFRGDYEGAVAYGSIKNYEHIATLPLAINPTPTWEAAAIYAAAAPRLVNNPVESLEGTPLIGMVATNYYDWAQSNSLLFRGMSALQYTKDGSCTIKRAISMCQTRADGSADDAYLDINAAEAMERIRYEQRMAAIKQFTGTAAAKSNEGYAPGLRITTEDDVRAMLLSLYKDTLVREFGWCQAYDFYKSNLVVEQDPQNPSRFNFVDTPVLLSPFYILAGRAQFRKVAV